ncbi:MAG: Xaa-Pro peptidase family protein [Proteobacteria bacterium]|nr:Xaa-Pro peptidase family protein [Pseudomonadota bacterium]
MDASLFEPYHLTPAAEVERRLAALGRELDRAGADGALIFGPVNRFYLSGTMQAGALLVVPDGSAVQFVWRDPDRAAFESPVAVEGVASAKDVAPLVAERLGRTPGRLGFELAELPAGDLFRYQRAWPGLEPVDVSPLVMGLRAVKSDYEAELMARSGELAGRVYAAVPACLRPGITEIELAADMTRLAMSAGHINTVRMNGFGAESFNWHVVAGRSGSVQSTIDAPFAGVGLSPAFPMGAGRRRIEINDQVLIDFGLCLDGYLVDLTRMFSLGRPAERVMAAFEALEAIEDALRPRLRPDEICSDLYRLALEAADRLGWADAFLGFPGKKSRFAGHGLGLQLNEPPFLAPGHDLPLRPGHVVLSS